MAEHDCGQDNGGGGIRNVKIPVRAEPMRLTASFHQRYGSTVANTTRYAIESQNDAVASPSASPHPSEQAWEEEKTVPNTKEIVVILRRAE